MCKKWMARGLATLALLVYTACAQVDTVFWFAAPEISANGNFDYPVILVLTAQQQTATVTVSIPANPAYPVRTKTIAANTVDTVVLADAANRLTELPKFENTPPNQVLNKGLYITSSAPITAYYEVRSACNCNPELYALKGENALGTNFLIPFQTTWNNSGSYSPTPFATFDIVATEDNTTVTITPTQNIVGHTANVAYNVVLNRGQTYSARAASQSAALHPAGSRVVADKPIAITMSDDLLLLGGCADVMGDQMVPVDKLGDEYIVVKNDLTGGGGERFYVLATENNTEVYVNNALVTTLAAGVQSVHIFGPALVAYVTTSHPVYVLHASGMGCEIGGAILPAITCTGSSQVGIARSLASRYRLSVIVPTGGEDDFTVNGNAGIITAAMFADVPNTGGTWKFMSREFSTAQFPIGAHLIRNSSQTFHLGIIEGDGGGGARFGYFSSVTKLEPQLPDALSLCPGDSLTLDPGNFSFYTWDNGHTGRTRVVKAGGTYKVDVLSGNCTATDSVVVTELPLPVISFATDTVHICSGRDTLIQSPGTYTNYLWQRRNTDNTLTDLGSGSSLTLSAEARYLLTVTNSDGCKATDSLELRVHPLPDFTANILPEACGDDGSIDLTPSGGTPPYSYIWADGPTSPTRTGLAAGSYTATIIDALGCRTTHTQVVGTDNTVKTDFTASISPEACGDDGTITLTPSAGTSPFTFLWADGPTGSTRTGLAAGSYTATIVDANGCRNTHTLTVGQDPGAVPTAVISVSPPLIGPVRLGSSLSFLGSGANAATYGWTFAPGDLATGSGPHIRTYTQAGNYCVKLVTTSAALCQDSATVCFRVVPMLDLRIPNVFSPNLDGLNDVFYIEYTTPPDNYSLEIYDRWGVLLWSTTNPATYWDGTTAAGPCPEGVYFYSLRLTLLGEQLQRSGNVTLLR